MSSLRGRGPQTSPTTEVIPWSTMALGGEGVRQLPLFLIRVPLQSAASRLSARLEIRGPEGWEVLPPLELGALPTSSPVRTSLR